MTTEGEVYDVFTGVCIKRAFRKQYEEKFIVAVGNTILEIVYAVGLNITCYDPVKRKNVVTWFKEAYQR
jgi:hypothetical protein